MTSPQPHTNENHSQSQVAAPPLEPPAADLLRYGDETGHDPAMQWVGRQRLTDYLHENRVDDMIRRHDRHGP